MRKRIQNILLTVFLLTGMVLTYIPTAYAADNISATDIVSVSKTLAGKYQYVSGGASPSQNGFDCTGLVYYIYHTRLGYNMTLEQARNKSKLLAMGTKITDKSQLLPGDIIQYTISHVAIYVGDNKVLHAGTDRGVCYTTLENKNPKYNRIMSYAIRLPGVIQGHKADTPQTPPPTTYVTITFDPNGGTVSPRTQKIVKGSDPSNLPVPVREGYTFKGWVFDKIDPDNPPSSGSGGMILENSAWGFEKDTTIYAFWVKNEVSTQYTVTLDDGSTCKQISVTNGGTYSGLTNPTKDGYTFDGWFTQESGGARITTSTKVNLAGDQTLYAHWTKNPSLPKDPPKSEDPVPELPHTHSGSFKYAESSHPHLNHYTCSTCGADYTDGSTSPDKKCDQCWGSWSVWSYTPAYSSETRQVEIQHTETQVKIADAYTEYRYGGYATSDGNHECWCDTYLRSKFGSANLRYSDWSTTKYRENGKGWSCGQCSGNHIHVGHYDGNGNAWWPEYTLPSGKNYYWEETRTVPAQYETHIETSYRYRDWTHG